MSCRFMIDRPRSGRKPRLVGAALGIWILDRLDRRQARSTVLAWHVRQRPAWPMQHQCLPPIRCIESIDRNPYSTFAVTDGCTENDFAWVGSYRIRGLSGRFKHLSGAQLQMKCPDSSSGLISRSRATGQQATGDVVEPKALANVVKFLSRFHELFPKSFDGSLLLSAWLAARRAERSY